ncbi:uncharacterized protein LOC123274035 [Cotesia glomerata]|uniref:uncharacterized protein LOC123274035 n=1 Tax=Cotesia glomerata TaxID=32391 RepID=UPI001D002FA9|nr:uncharacterized protein LOC123274035 [Cotesia glomerata]
MLIIFFFSHLLSSVTGSVTPDLDAIELQPVKYNPGLLYDPYKRVHTVEREWNIISTIDIGAITNQDHQAWKDPVAKMIASSGCNISFTVIECSSILQEHLLSDLKDEKNAILRRIESTLEITEEEPPYQRNRRTPWFGFVGKIAREVFGLMDYDDHEHLSQEIDRLYQDQREITVLVNNATHIIRAEVNKIIADEIKTRNKLQRLSESMSHYQLKLEEEELRMKLRINLMLLSEKWIQHLNRWIRYLQRVESAIETAKRGHISNDILSPDQLLRATADITKRYPDLNAPQPKDHINVQGLVDVAKIVIGRTGKKLVISITLPLFHPVTYQLYSLKSITTSQIINGVTRGLTIRPKKNFLGIDALHSQYFIIDEEFIKECRPIANDLACHPNFPIKNINEDSDCEVLLLIKPSSKILNSCDTRILPKCDDEMIKLHAPNSWA